MKASELMKKLQEQIELHGDCEVYISHYDGTCDCGHIDKASGAYFDDELGDVICIH
jgi:hypothetical protein